MIYWPAVLVGTLAGTAASLLMMAILHYVFGVPWEW